MIVNFSIQNFGSIKDKQTLSFEADASKYLEDTYVVHTAGKRLLKLALIYGANASGKTTVLKALDFLRDLVVNPKEMKYHSLKFSPFLFDKKTILQPSFLSIEFVQNSICYLYEVKFTHQSILSEKLISGEVIVYSRETSTEKLLTEISFGNKITISDNEKKTLEINTLHNNTVLGGYLKTNVDIDILKEKKCDAVFGIGGGKTLDAAKAVSYYENIPVFIVPTIASTDAPCSALSVIYTPNGEFEEYLFLKANPDMVIMDTDVIVNAPARLLVAGIGDALATYYEAKACVDSNASSIAGGGITKAAIAIAELCKDTLFQDGLKAKIAVENKVVTQAVENIIEANTYLSGIGFESGGLAAAHAIHNGLTILEEGHHMYHGEKVAFGTITQLVLENRCLCEIKKVIEFCKSVGLPTTLDELGMGSVSKERLYEVAKASTAEGETIHNMPFKVTADDVFAAILVADKLGKN